MFQKFYTNTIESNYIKYLLQNTYIPTIPFVENINHISKNQLYIFENYIVRAKQSEEVVEILNAIREDRNNYYRYFHRYDKYIFGKQYKGLTTNYISNTSMYDSETHFYLGEYLRAIKAYYKIDLMPFYNCFSDEYISSINIQPTYNNIPPYVKFTQESNPNYKIISIPIRFCQEYTIAIESDQTILCMPAFVNKKGIIIDLTSKLHDTLSISYHKDSYKQSNYIINNNKFKYPFYYSSPCIPGENNSQQLNLITYEKYLRLLIRVPISNSSTITVLEGHYSNLPTLCDKEINLDLQELSSFLLNKDYIETNFSNYSDNEILQNYEKGAPEIIELFCRNLSKSIKTCPCQVPSNTYPNAYSCNIFDISFKNNQSYTLQIDNIKRVQNKLVSANLFNEPSIDLYPIFGNSFVHVVGDSSKIKLKIDNNKIDYLSQLNNQIVNISEYSNLIFDDVSEINNTSDILLSNGEKCLTCSTNPIVKGQFQVNFTGVNTNTYQVNFNFMPDPVNNFKGTLTYSHSGIEEGVPKTYKYEIVSYNNKYDMFQFEGYAPLSLLINKLTNTNQLEYKCQQYSIEGTVSYPIPDEVSGNAGEIINQTFLYTHTHDFSLHKISIPSFEESNIEILNKYADQAKSYYEIQFKQPQQVNLKLNNNLPIVNWGFKSGIASEFKLDEYLNKHLITNLSLLRLNDHNSYAFTSRLYEYLINNVITNNDNFGENIKFVQDALNVIPTKIWTPELRIKVFNTLQQYLNNYELPNLMDLNGFIDKDSELILYNLSK